jgi:hypothetical protein
MKYDVVMEDRTTIRTEAGFAPQGGDHGDRT